MGVRGFGLVLGACALILRFARKYYVANRSRYTTQQQGFLEALFEAAEWIATNLKGNVLP